MNFYKIDTILDALPPGPAPVVCVDCGETVLAFECHWDLTPDGKVIGPKCGCIRWREVDDE